MTSRTGQALWGWALRQLLLPAGDRVFRQHMMSRLRFLEEAQWWPRERIIRYREEQLQLTLRVAYETVPLYRELMDAARLDPHRLRAEDLARMPPVTKEVLRENYPDRTTRPTGYKVLENRTSGSTGTNFIVLTDTQTMGWYRASLLLMLQWAGWHLGEAHLQTGMNLERSVDRRLKDWMLRCRYVSAFDLTDERLDRVLESMEVRRIRHLWGYPGSLYYLARRALARGWNESLRSVVTWGDMLFSRYRDTISRAFGCGVHDTYGCAEGIEVAGQCGHEDGYHILDLDVLVEFVDDEGNPALPSETGSLLLTRLHPGPMPLIRYRVGDLGRAGPGVKCSCGRQLARMKDLEGRETDVIQTPRGNRLIVHFFTGILEHFDEIDSFQVVQESVESVVLRLVPQSGFSRESGERIVKALQENGADDVRFEVDVVSDIPVESTGKRKFVVSRIGEQTQS